MKLYLLAILLVLLTGGVMVTTENGDRPDSDDAFAVVRGTEGFWRIAQDTSGVWWFLSPDNQTEFLNTINTVQPFQRARSAFGPHYISQDWDGGATSHGDIDAWAAATLPRVLAAGFKGLGAWSHPRFHQMDVAMTRDLNIWLWMAGDARRLYSPEWPAIAEEAVKAQVLPLRDNRNLIGYFTDNELDWGDGTSGPRAYFDGLAPEDPNRRMVVQVIRSLWPDIDSFNTDWNTDLAHWADLDQWERLPYQPQRTYGRLYSAWLYQLASDYFRITTALIRQYDPNHLILGVRFKGHAPPEVVRASRDYTDAQSLNYYVADARLDMEMFEMMYRESGQPIIIGEYAFHALDGRSGNRNTVGFSAQVFDQQARADGYRLMTSRLARVPWVIGAEWFQWMDEPPSGRSADGEDVNFGIVDIDDRPYEHMIQAILETTPRLNDLHAASHQDQRADIWRESFARKPLHRAPYLDRPIRINGNLSDWPEAARVRGVRHADTVGLERSILPLPNLFVGWNEQGLFIGMEVIDHDIQGAPADGWWWTRDNAEFWIATRPARDDQQAYDEFSHQFFFVPQEFPAHDGIAGTIGQWHRRGDALTGTGHLIPHPDVQKAVRVLHDRYVVEMLIPASALNGFDAQNHPELAFNMHVRNFQHALDYFWSAPKELRTQYQPRTWGRLILHPPGQGMIAHID
jgi:hypothetical protein